MNHKSLRLSAIVIVKNEASRLGQCLKGLKWADELLVVDNGSTDRTLRIAKEYAAIIVETKGNDFSKLRNLGKEAATGDWLLYVDADERVTPALRREVEKVMQDFDPAKSPHAYFLTRKNYYLGAPWPYKDKMERLFWRQSLHFWKGELHESANFEGKTAVLNEHLLHYTHRNLEEMLEKTNQWSVIEARLRLAAGHPPVIWWRLLRVMSTGFYNSFIRQGGWRAGTVGWIESIYQAFSLFITYAKLWELQEHQKN